jgi:ligand-binding sensor domain-containing protein/signal transduction histidine kinase
MLCRLLLFGLTVDVRAQPADEATNLVVDTWQIDAGLPHNSVTALLQTKDGYLWVGTSNGLARFDGIRFTTFRILDHPRLKSNRILCLHEDAQGVLWIGTDEGGLASCRSRQFSSLGTAEGLSSDTVLCLGDDQAGDLWVGTASGLNRLRDGQFTTFFKPDGLPDDRVGAIGQPPGAPMVIATGKGLCQFSGERLGLYGAAAWTQTQSNLCCLHTDREGRLWVGGELGLFRLPATGTNSVDPPAKLSSASVLCVAERADGGIWFGTSAGDLWRAAPGATNNLGTQRVWHFPNPVTALREDGEGNLWAGTAGDGLHRLKRRQLQLVPLAERLGQRWAPCVLETADAELRLLAGDKGIYRLQGGRFTLLERLPLPDGVAVQTVCATRTGGLWIGTLRDGLFECGKGVLNQFSERDGLSDSAIEVLCAEPDGALWVGTRNGGLNHFKDRVVRRFSTPWGFTGNYACALEKDSQGGLWIGTCGDGLFQLKRGRFIAYTETNGLPSREIRALHADPDGSLWVGTSSGLCRVKDERVSSFTVRQGLAEEAILQLRSDDEGNLWLGSNSGISRVRKDQLNACAEGRASFLDMVSYGKEDGLPGLQCLPEVQSGPSRNAAGWLWFSTTKGLVIFSRRGLQRNTLPPPVVIEHVFVENEDVPLNASIRVAPGKESLRFQYTALSFTAPGKVSFQYQLEGFDRDWSEVSFSRTARYPKVPPGRYVFRVLARNNDGIWNKTGASAAIVVVPFWWATVGFRLAGALAAMAALGSLYRLRQTRRREIEGLRVRIASDLHDDVGSSLWSITLLSRMLSKHGKLEAQERQDVDEIHRIALQTSNSIRDIIWLINPAFDTMQDLVLRTKDFAGTALRGVEYRLHCEGPELSRKLPLDFRQNLFFLFKEALTNIARHAQATVAEVRIEEDGGRWRVSVHDNGSGFDPAAGTGGNGLRNLRARARKMGAELEIHSQPGQGTTLTLTVAPP